MKEKKVLIVGASALQVPMILKAKELGYTVGVVDYNPEAVGIPLADRYYNASTIDPQGVYEAARDFGADGITTVATDMPMRSIAFACEKLGLLGIDTDTALRSTDKGRMIEAFEKGGVPHPWFYIVKDKNYQPISDKLSYPCICKPTDNAGSRGVVVIKDASALADAVKYSSSRGRSGDVIIEELLTGNEISVEAFAVGGQVHVLAITDKITTGSPHFVEMGHSQPSVFEGEVKAEIIRATEKAMHSVGIMNGPAHVEMMVTESGPRLIELGARMGGDFITTDLVPLSTGIDMLAATILLACGEKVDLKPAFSMGSAVRYMKTGSGVIRKIEGMEKAKAVKGVRRISLFKSEGDTVGPVRDSLDRVGVCIAQGKTALEAGAICEEALKMVHIVTEE